MIGIELSGASLDLERVAKASRKQTDFVVSRLCALLLIGLLTAWYILTSSI